MLTPCACDIRPGQLWRVATGGVHNSVYVWFVIRKEGRVGLNDRVIFQQVVPWSFNHETWFMPHERVDVNIEYELVSDAGS